MPLVAPMLSLIYCCVNNMKKSFLYILFLIYLIIPTIANGATDITIGTTEASARFLTELNKIEGFKTSNARLIFSETDGVEGSAYPVTVDAVKVPADDTVNHPFIEYKDLSMAISGGVFASGGTIQFALGKVEPQLLGFLHIEDAVDRTLQSFAGKSYIGSVEIKNDQIIAHVVDNPYISAKADPSSGSTIKPSSGGIVPDCNVTGDTVADGQYATKYRIACDFEMLIKLVNKFINFLLVYIATPLAAIIFAYAGFMLIFSGGNEHKLGKAKHMILAVFAGYVIALIAWLVIKTILSTLGFPDAWSFLKSK